MADEINSSQVMKYGVGFVIGVAILLVILGTAGTLSGSFENIGVGIQKYIFFGTEDISVDIATTTGQIGGIITAFMIWLIIFASFGDIIENFSAFSEGIAWVIAFAIAVVAANVGVIQAGMVWLVAAFAWAGTFTVFASLIAAFVAFFAVNWGIQGATNWLKRRQTMMHAATGRTYVSQGLEGIGEAGKKFAKLGKNKS